MTSSVTTAQPDSTGLAGEPATLVVDLTDLSVRHASPTALAWLGLASDRLLGRSLMLSLPVLGQTLTLAVAGGLGPQPQTLAVDLARTDHAPLRVEARRQGADAIIDLAVAAHSATAPVPALPGSHHDDAPVRATDLQHRLVSMRDEIARLRTLAEARVTAQADLRALSTWLWQAEVALTRMLERYEEVADLARRHGSEQADRL